MTNLRPTERIIFNLLKDGCLHPLAEIHQLLDGDLTETSTVYMHISMLRRKLEAEGYGILSVRKGYRLVRFLSSAYPV